MSTIRLIYQNPASIDVLQVPRKTWRGRRLMFSFCDQLQMLARENPAAFLAVQVFVAKTRAEPRQFDSTPRKGDM
jgi:hypothetical protein